MPEFNDTAEPEASAGWGVINGLVCALLGADFETSALELPKSSLGGDKDVSSDWDTDPFELGSPARGVAEDSVVEGS